MGHGRKPPNPQKIPPIHGRRPSPPPTRTGRKECCFAGQAVKAVWLGKFRLARRFARLDLKTRLGVL